jgi:DNA-binding response OmpR family regulator
VESSTRGRIIVADDDPQIRSLLVVLLERRGFQCIDVPNGLAAYEAAKREKPDLVLIDWMMPVMDGRETVERLKRDPETNHIPVVMLTGQSQIGDKVSALEAGVQDFITKPFDSRELVARVEQQMRWRRLLADEPSESSPEVPNAPDRALDPAQLTGDVWTKATDAAALGKHEEALALFLHEAESSEEKKRFPRAAIAYRSAAVEAAAQHKAQMANKLLRLAGKMYLNWAETADDAHAIQDGYVNAARCFLAAGNLKLAKKSIDFASSYDSVISDAGAPPVT